MIPIQSNATGFSGRPITLYSAYDGDAAVLAIVIANEFNAERHKNSVLITNDTSTTIDRDAIFGEKDIKEAIQAYYTLRSGVATDGKSPRITFGDRASNADPASAIERDGVDASGFKYRIAETISCAQVATLMACWYAVRRADTVQNMFSMADALVDLSERLNLGEAISL